MNHLISSLSKMSAIAALLGSAGCADSDHQQASQPANTYAQTAPASPQDNSTMASSGAPGSTSGTSTDSTSGSGTMGTGATGQNGSLPQTGTSGATSQYGNAGSTGNGPSTGSTMAQGGSAGQGQNSNGQSGPTGAMGAASFDDPQIAAVVIALNQGEIQEAQLAQTKAKSPEVKTFAAHMVHAHQGMLAKSKADFSNAQITPNDSNPTCQQLQTDVQSQLSSLQSVSGKDFDRRYIDDQVKAHSDALDLIDRMISSAKSAQLKAGLQEARTKVEGHLRDAKALQQKLQGS